MPINQICVICDTIDGTRKLYLLEISVSCISSNVLFKPLYIVVTLIFWGFCIVGFFSFHVKTPILLFYSNYKRILFLICCIGLLPSMKHFVIYLFPYSTSNDRIHSLYAWTALWNVHIKYNLATANLKKWIKSDVCFPYCPCIVFYHLYVVVLPFIMKKGRPVCNHTTLINK